MDFYFYHREQSSQSGLFINHGSSEVWMKGWVTGTLGSQAGSQVHRDDFRGRLTGSL